MHRVVKVKFRWIGLLWIASVAVSAFADLAGPISLYRLHRVGYEMLKEETAVGEEFPFWMLHQELLRSVVCCGLVVFWVLSLKRVRSNLSNVVWSCLRRCKMEYMILAVLGISMIVGVGYYFIRDIRNRFTIMGYGKIYDSGPGWRCPDQVPDHVRVVLMDRLKAVKDDLQAAVDLSGFEMEPAPAEYRQISRLHYERESMSILTRVLSESDSLRFRCRGIPIEWLRESIRFKTREVDRDH